MNHLKDSTSPYLLQHAGNPVDWYAWSPESLERSRVENKPIFLSIGYAACHWCHVMAHESFEDSSIATLMNEGFICIKVDREERPDLDGIYMAAAMALTGSGGWPLSVFLTPALRPFYAGTYFPPTPRYNLPSFRDLLISISDTWRNDPSEVERIGEKLTEHIKRQTAKQEVGDAFTQDLLNNAVKHLNDNYDWSYGGWGQAPKFPQPMTIEFLQRRAFQKDETAGRMTLHALHSMALGGIYDVVGGGFSRYSVDNFWRIPHFEKMLYDSAQLATVYLRSWQMTRKPFYKRIATETLDFIQREMTNNEGGFYSSLDADSENIEGKFYVWTYSEIRKVLGSDFDLFKVAYGITEEGNWEGKTILQRALDDASLAASFKINPEKIVQILTNCHARLLKARNERIRPGTDDKVLTAWNGLMLRAFAEASRILDDTDIASRYFSIAARNAEFLLSSLRQDGKLHRAWRNGRVGNEVFLEDYASLILGLLELYQSDFNNRWFGAAKELANEMTVRFSDPEGGFFDTPNDGESLLVRPKDLLDNATPSGNSLACEALLKIASLTGDGNLRGLAEKSLRLLSNSALRYPTGFARWLCAADFALANVKQIAILYSENDKNIHLFLDKVRTDFMPNTIVSASIYPPSKDAPLLLSDRPLKEDKLTAYVCENFICNLPVNSLEEFQDQLRNQKALL
jgi:uncharacterized protein YyaL (SSP411 family)